MQASHARMGQQRSSIGQPSPTGGNTASPINPLTQLQNPSTPSNFAAGSPTVNGTALNSTGSAPSIMPVQLTQQQKEILAQQQQRIRNNSIDQPSPSTPSNSAVPPTPTGSATMPARPAAGPSQALQQRRQFVGSLAAYYKSKDQPLPQAIFNGERDGEVKVAGCWVDVFDLFMVIMRAQGVANVSPSLFSH